MPDETIAATRNVSVVHGVGRAATHALRDVSVEVRDGERVALVGASGSGKTTLLQVLGGISAPTSGSVSWLGAPLSDLDSQARGGVRASGIAYVFQGSSLFPTLSVAENVAFAARAARKAAAGVRANRSVPARDPLPYDSRELLALVGLERYADRLPTELSGGEQQRVAIARALAQNPRMLLCDEPTGHLDTDTAQRMLDMLDALQDRLGFALVVATHDERLAAGMTRRIKLVDGQADPVTSGDAP